MKIAFPLAPLVLFAAACQVSPYSEQNFSATDQQIPFQGCSLSANSPIQITAGEQTPGPITWDVLATTTSAATVSYTDSLQTPWYCWQANVRIPTKYWWYSPPTKRYATAVKTLEKGSPLYTYVNDPSLCTQPAGTAQLTGGAAPCALPPVHSGNATGMNDTFAGSMVITASQLSIY